MLLNIRSINSTEKRAMSSAHLERYEPHMVALNETWLDTSVARLDIPNYQCVSLRDRPDSKVGVLNHGGVALYSCVGSILVTPLEDSKIAERSWHITHMDLGCILFRVWYRPPGSPHSKIESLDGELARLSTGVLGTLIMGDVHIWHRSWLKHSPADTTAVNGCILFAKRAI